MEVNVTQDKNFFPFSESPLWDINVNYYQEHGLEAWRSELVPHQSSSNSRVAKTNAELILGYLKDLAFQGKTSDTVYIVELGAGHGRLAYHILKHLDRLIGLTNVEVPQYCYVLTDIVESNLDYFLNHPQFEDYLASGKLDVSFFNGVSSEELNLRYAKQTITKGSVNQSIIVIANYFFDSIPTDLFFINEDKLYACDVALYNSISDEDKREKGSINKIKLEYINREVKADHYSNQDYNKIMQSYKSSLKESHIYFPRVGIECINMIRGFTTDGLMLISLDKGHHEIGALQNIGVPDLVIHGSFSIWVNFHALAAYCKMQDGFAYVPSFATNALQCVCLLFDDNHLSFDEVNNAYERFVNDFGPDDYITLKKMSYDKIATLSTEDLIAMLRLSNYDSTIFINYLPRFKQLATDLSIGDRRRLAQTMHKVWDMYFTIHEPFDLPFELGGLFFDLAFYQEAKFYFEQSIKLFGTKPDSYYNIALCHYQLREDAELVSLIQKAKLEFPSYKRLADLDKLNLEAT